MKKWIKTLETIKNEAITIDQNRLNIDQTSTKNQPKIQPQINQKSIKINQQSTKIRQKIEVWKAPGQVWRRLGPAWAIQDVLRAILDRFGTVLEASWRPLGGPDRLKIRPKIDQFYDASWNRFFSVFQ